MIKVVIADDQELIRESLKIVLDQNEDIEVTGVAENGQILMDMLLVELLSEKTKIRCIA